MSVTADFYKLSKRKNSTKQPTGTGTVYSVDLKSGTSFISPTLLLSNSGKPDFNYVSFEGSYYFITDIISVRNDLWEIDCSIDALATAKTAILSSTQFVSYSSYNSNTWLADTRIPLESKGVGHKTDIVFQEFSRTGTYILSVIGKNGCELWKVTENQLKQLLDKINDWSDDLSDFSFNGKNIDGSQTVATYQWDTTDLGKNFESLGKMITLSGLFSNAYNAAPSCIRSCIWVPFKDTIFPATHTDYIYLGQFNTLVLADAISAAPYTSSFSPTIPWTYSDWRRSICEDIYLYLPLVGLIPLESSNITSNSSITIDLSITPTDGCIAYEIKSGMQVIGTYGGSCAANYPIGVSQQASAGDIVTSILNGAEKAVTMGVQSSISPISAANAAAGVGLEAAKTAYDVTHTMFSRNNTCIGGIGGGVGAGLDLNASLYIVDHDTIITPSSMAATMGLPTMTPMSLSSLTGYCECANAHVELALPSSVMDMVDSYLNSGFFIE